MTWQRGEMCESCAGRRGTEANASVETRATLAECIKTGEPFYCHESVAERDPNGTAVDNCGKRYRRLPFQRWRLCRAWMNAQAKDSPHNAAVTDGRASRQPPLMNQNNSDDSSPRREGT